MVIKFILLSKWKPIVRAICLDIAVRKLAKDDEKSLCVMSD